MRASLGPRRRRRRSCSTPARSRPIRGSICCSRRWRSCGGAARRAAAAGRRQAGSGRRRAAQARAAGIEDVTIFAGERPAEEIPAYLLAADVLVSPRSRGTNTPLKIYQYLRSGKPIVATRLLTHTQVLDDDTAILTGATPQEFADGILAALDRPARAGGDRPQRARRSPRRSTATRPTSSARARPAPRCWRRRAAGAV